MCQWFLPWFELQLYFRESLLLSQNQDFLSEKVSYNFRAMSSSTPMAFPGKT